MKFSEKQILFLLCVSVFFISCGTMEKASIHGLTSGNYRLKSENNNPQPVYLDISNEQIAVFHRLGKQTDLQPFLTIATVDPDSLGEKEFIFKKQSLDIDITSILLKHRPSVNGSPAQLTTDFNIAGYIGWRFDKYVIKSKKTPVGKSYRKINSLGYDFGVFAGPGTTTISPFTTNNRRADEYSGMILQTGIAGFIESNVASFGLSIGYDHLMNADRKIWIYRNKPWVGFIVGIALN